VDFQLKFIISKCCIGRQTTSSHVGSDNICYCDINTLSLCNSYYSLVSALRILSKLMLLFSVDHMTKQTYRYMEVLSTCAVQALVCYLLFVYLCLFPLSVLYIYNAMQEKSNPLKCAGNCSCICVYTFVPY